MRMQLSGTVWNLGMEEVGIRDAMRDDTGDEEFKCLVTRQDGVFRS